MSDKHTEFAEQLLKVRPVTRELVYSVLMDHWPNHTAIVDFGIDSQKHYEALYYPIREAEIMPQALDSALGHGEKLTTLVREAPSNPHADVEFHTSWDIIRGAQFEPDVPESGESYSQLLESRSAVPQPKDPERER